MSDVYDGQVKAGSISVSPSGVVAFDIRGKKIGIFQTRTEAVRCVLSPLSPPASPAEKAPHFDAENALRRAIDALVKEGGR